MGGEADFVNMNNKTFSCGPVIRSAYAWYVDNIQHCCVQVSLKTL